MSHCHHSTTATTKCAWDSQVFDPFTVNLSQRINCTINGFNNTVTWMPHTLALTNTLCPLQKHFVRCWNWKQCVNVTTVLGHFGGSGCIRDNEGDKALIGCNDCTGKRPEEPSSWLFGVPAKDQEWELKLLLQVEFSCMFPPNCPHSFISVVEWCPLFPSQMFHWWNSSVLSHANLSALSSSLCFWSSHHDAFSFFTLPLFFVSLDPSQWVQQCQFWLFFCHFA